MTREEALERRDRIRYNLLNLDDKAAVDIAFDALQNCSPWISVEERLPDDSFMEKEIIVCILNRFGEINVYTKKFWGLKSALWNNDITHWMPLPEAPKEEA